MENENIFSDKKLPLCLKKAKFAEHELYILGVPNSKLQTKQHRIFPYYKPVSKLMDYKND
jgi:hypothetical protein